MSWEPALQGTRSIAIVHLDEHTAQLEIPDAGLIVNFDESQQRAKLQMVANALSDNPEEPRFSVSIYYDPRARSIRLMASGLHSARYPMFFVHFKRHNHPEIYEKLSRLLKRRGRWPNDVE